jgi:hypothetical protein
MQYNFITYYNNIKINVRRLLGGINLMEKEKESLKQRNDQEISVLTVNLKELESSRRQMFPTPSEIAVKSSTFAVKTLSANLRDFVDVLGKVVESLPDKCGSYNIDTLTFSLSIDGSGKISLIGEMSAGFTSGIIITLKKQATL